jgi:agmatinase
MRATELVTGLLATFALTAAHEHAEFADTQEPFVGWTQEDLDAKWGTDV